MLHSVILLALLVPCGCEDSPGEKVELKGGGFTLRFPGKPKVAKHTTTTPIGKLTIHTATYATADGSVYLASYTEFPKEAVKKEVRETLLDGVVKGLAGRSGKVVSEKKEIMIGKEKGREVLIDKGNQQTRFRLLVKDQRLIQFALIGTGEFVTGDAAKAFLDSFSLED